MLQPITRLRYLVAATAAILAFATGFAAEEKVRDYQLEESVSDTLSTKYKELMDAKNFDGAVDTIDAQLAKLSDKTSYDACVLYMYRFQTLLQKNDYAGALESLERSITLSDSHSPTYFDERASTESSYTLAILYYQEAASLKNPTVIASYFDKAETYMERWNQHSKKKTPDALSFYASLLYNRAIADADHPDHARIIKAMEIVDQGLHQVTHPKDSLYILKLVCLQQLNRNAEATELLEVLVKQKPENKTFWAQLAALYLNANQDVRAIVAFERAQSYGHMNAPKDNLNLVGIHFNLAQYGRAAELLEKGLHNGGIDNELKNWELLASCYQQLNRDLKAIDVLKEATTKFPREGQIEYLIAQNYYNLDKYPEALKHLQLSVSKGGGHKPYQTYLFLAFIAFDLKKFDIALDAANKAIAIPDGAKEGLRMKQAIDDAIKERENKLAK